VGVTNYEKETIINFNEEEDIAYIYTHNTTWQAHLEGKLGLKPTATNRDNGREYELDKKRIRMPQLKKKMSEETREKLRLRLRKMRDSKA